MILEFCGQPITTLWDSALTDRMTELGLTFEDITELHVTHCSLQSLDGIERFVNLETLDASDNHIDAFSSLWSMKNLRAVKLRNNKFMSLCICQIRGASVLVTLDEADAPVGPVYSANYKLLDLEANQISCVLAEPGVAVEVECLLLAKNCITDISGMFSFTGLNTLDLTGNATIDAKSLVSTPFSSGVRIFMQDCAIINDSSLIDLLQRDQDAEIIVPGSVLLNHPRMVKVEPLKFDLLPQKEFIDFQSEFADFRYVGDMLPCELKTPRVCDSVSKDTQHFVVRTQCPAKQMATLSTVTDIADAYGGCTVPHDGATLPLGCGTDSEATLSINAIDSPTGHVDFTPSLKYFSNNDAFCNERIHHQKTAENGMAKSWSEKITHDIYTPFAPMPDTTLRPADSTA
ncbi:internalin, putative [Babesia ovis]|uniref:Internalin, putative n=1 Tax=Babesia ovis TaxID=5869 RepID=A0A9W5T8F5_BABOV|nr:internalin, putative [Babesia ovis]